MTLHDAEEIEQLAYQGAIRLEITGGIPTWEAFPSFKHQRLIDRIRATITPHGAGDACLCLHVSDALFRFPDGSLKRPDIAIFCIEPPDQEGALTVIPEAVIEVVSKGYEYKDIILNPPFYLSHSVRDVVIYDPASTIVVHHTAAGAIRHHAPIALTLTCGCDCAIPR